MSSILHPDLKYNSHSNTNSNEYILIPIPIPDQCEDPEDPSKDFDDNFYYDVRNHTSPKFTIFNCNGEEKARAEDASEN